MKLRKKDKRAITKRIIALVLAGVGTISLASCKNSTKKDVESSNQEIVYDVGKHQVIDVQRSFQMLVGKEGRYGLIAPDGYKIIDYDYDSNTEDWMEFDDYVYSNTVPVKTKDKDEIGTPVDDISYTDSNVYKAGTHVIADIKRSFNPFVGKEEKICLTAPTGYDIMDYDYDKGEDFEYETITYINNCDVTVDDINNFGTPTDLEKKEQKGYYDVGEHKIVVIDRNFNPLLGKEKMMRVSAPLGYKVIDYDYDKTPYFDFQTITYENTTPVTYNVNDFGKPIDENYTEKNTDGEYDTGKHVLVKINRNIDWSLFGFNGTKEVEKVEIYDVLDYDYEKSDDFEFETYVYVNNVPVKTNDENEFGSAITKVK